MYINMEFQKLVKGATLLRQRFYNAMIDIDALEEGDEFTDLPKIVLFLFAKKIYFIKTQRKIEKRTKLEKFIIL